MSGPMKELRRGGASGAGLRRALGGALLGAWLLAGAAPGCVTIGRQHEGAELPLERVQEIRVGKTSRRDVLALLGPPITIQRRDLDSIVQNLATRYTGGVLNVTLDPALLDDVYFYEFRRVNRKAIFLGVFNYFSSVEKSDRVVVFFDRNGVVSAVGSIQGTKEL